jgi:phage-related baseplate assembly protein
MKSGLFPALPDIVFAERDPAVIERELINGYEQAYQLRYGVERKLYPGDPARLILESVAFELVHQRQLIDYTGKMNLLAYSAGDKLDHLGAHLGVTRLPARSALTTLKFTLSEPQIGVSIIPAGTRATPGGGDIVFAATKAVEISAGKTEAEVPAQCAISGTAGNGFLPGQVKKIVDPFPWQMSVENITVSYGGADVESDENFRERIQIAPESFSVAGARNAYISWARAAHQSVTDVAVVGPPETEPGNVEIYPLMTGGELPTQEILNLVYETCNAEDIRPLTDYVHVLTPVPVPYALELRYWIERLNATRVTAIQAAVGQAVKSWILWQRTKIGRDIIPSELVHRIQAAGAKRVEVIAPEYTALNYKQLAVISGDPVVVYGGLEDA